MVISEDKFSKEMRTKFPFFNEQNSNKVYLDSAATTQRFQGGLTRMNDFDVYENANIHRGNHSCSVVASNAYEEARTATKDYINANSSREIVFLRGVTEAINLVAQSFLRGRLSAGNEILISIMEHHSNIIAWQFLAVEIGAKIVWCNITSEGEIDLDDYKSKLNHKVKLVALCHVSNVLGTINPIKQLVALAHDESIPVLIDGAQAGGHIDIDVQAIDCDFYCLSAHKMYGPTGVGCLYAKEQHLITMKPYHGGGGMVAKVSTQGHELADIPYRFEAGTTNFSAVIGFSEVLKFLKLTRLKRHASEQYLFEYAKLELKKIDNIQLFGVSENKIGIISFILQGIHAHDLGAILSEYGICVRAGHHCAMPLMDFFQQPSMVRLSLACYNTKEDVDKVISAIKEINSSFN